MNMKHHITLDIGTTNSRATLWYDGKAVGNLALSVGVKVTAADGSNLKLKQAVHTLAAELLAEHDLALADIGIIVASGMVSSNLGLIEVPHIMAPVSAADIANAMVCRRFSDVVDHDIWLVPGVKNPHMFTSEVEDDCVDMMRGEETEVVGLLERIEVREDALIVLPGSHTKFVVVDASAKIIGCMTTLAGETLAALTRHTVLADSLASQYADSFDAEMALRGYRLTNRYGLTRAAFMVRVYEQFSNLNRNQRANLLTGMIFAEDLRALRNSLAIRINTVSRVWVVGEGVLAGVLSTLLQVDGALPNTVTVNSVASSHLAGFGALRLAKCRGLEV